MTAEQKEIGDMMAEALRKLRTMAFVTPHDVRVAEEMARRWYAVSGPQKALESVESKPK